MANMSESGDFTAGNALVHHQFVCRLMLTYSHQNRQLAKVFKITQHNNLDVRSLK